MNPTGGIIRSDAGGSGHFLAPRRKIIQGKIIKYRHKGVDYTCTPGQKVWMPCTGKIVRVANPYVSTEYTGIEIETKRMVLKIFYVEPYVGVIGKTLQIGKPFGTAQDISQKYMEFGVTPHVHVQIDMIDPDAVFNGGLVECVVDT